MFAVDQSREMIRLLDKKFGDDPNFTARLGEAENLPFADNQVDYVFANMYLHHVENPPAAIREMLRVLKPGGKLIITDLDAHDFEFLVHEQHDRWMGFKRVDIERWFRDAGLQNVGVDCLDENCCSESKSSNQQAEVSIFVATGSKLSKPPHNFSGDNHRQQLKNFVKQKYGEIADISDCGCGSSNESQDCFTERSEYSQLAGYVPEADLGLGCGIPTGHAKIEKGHMVVDLGAGAGLDAFAARSQVGDTGRVIGIDFTEEMVRKARTNNQKLGYGNVEFKLGDIENLPLPDAIADVVISNCVLNLVPDKGKAFREIHRILKPGGHFCISDIVSKGELPKAIRQSAELYAGCIAGAIPEKDYIEIIRRIGFKSIEINQSKHIQLSEILLSTHLPPNKVKNWDQHEFGLFSITVSGYKVGIAQ